jgi:hypothetical protein
LLLCRHVSHMRRPPGGNPCPICCGGGLRRRGWAVRVASAPRRDTAGDVLVGDRHQEATVDHFKRGLPADPVSTLVQLIHNSSRRTVTIMNPHQLLPIQITKTQPACGDLLAGGIRRRMLLRPGTCLRGAAPIGRSSRVKGGGGLASACTRWLWCLEPPRVFAAAPLARGAHIGTGPRLAVVVARRERARHIGAVHGSLQQRAPSPPRTRRCSCSRSSAKTWPVTPSNGGRVMSAQNCDCSGTYLPGLCRGFPPFYGA